MYYDILDSTMTTQTEDPLTLQDVNIDCLPEKYVWMKVSIASSN